MRERALVLLVSVGVLGLRSGSAAANDRHFTYTYETATLNAGDVELEPWTTYRFGRERYYSRFDQRLELEVGVTDHLMSAWYLNLTSVAADVEDDAGVVARESELEFAGVSSEWKLKLTDPVADVLGSALYLEGTLAPTGAEVEGKVLLDKRVGQLLLAANLVGEFGRTWEERGETEDEVELATLLAAAWILDERASVGLELRQLNELAGGSELESAVLYVGPTVSYAAAGWWSALTLLPQVAAFAGATEGHRFDLERRERVQVRLLIGAHL